MSNRMRLIVGGGVTYALAIGLGYGYANGLFDGGRTSQGPGPRSIEGPTHHNTPPTDHNHNHVHHHDNNGIPSCGHVSITDTERHNTFGKNAACYDIEIGRDEFFMGLNLIRWWYLRQARGDVLEVGCGTGRNFTHYDYDKINKVVAIDSVPDMVAQALKKVSNPRKTSLYVMNAHTIQFPSQTFDTVVDTFGLCSYEDPVAVIKEMARVCKPEGTLIFIEHGKGTYTWINNILDKGAQQHAHNWGCIWNRDIEALVKEAGLQVTGVTRWHFGTTYIIQAKPGVTA